MFRLALRCHAMQPDPEFLGLCCRHVKFCRAQLGKVRDSPTGSLVHTISVGIAQTDPGLCCRSASIRHYKRSTPFLCQILSDLDHHSAGKGALSHHQVRYPQDDYPDEERYRPLKRVLPAKQPVQEEDAYRYRVDGAYDHRVSQKAQNEPGYIFALAAAGV